MHIAYIVISYSGLAVLLFGYARSSIWLKVGENRLRVSSGYGVIGNTLYVVANTIGHYTIFSAIFAAFLALNLYIWWNSGGNDGTKKFIKKYFSVKRLVPVTQH